MTNSNNILAALKEVLASCCPGQSFADDVSLITQGLGSLAATRFVFEVQHAMGKQVSVQELGAGMTLTALAQSIAGAAPTTGTVWAASNASLALLPLQQAFIVTSDPDYSADPAGCHIYREFALEGISAEAMIAAWERLLLQQPMLTACLDDSGALSLGQAVPLVVERVGMVAHESAVAARRSVWRERTQRTPARPLAAAIVCSEGTATLQLSIDGIVLDGYGLQLMLTQWQQLARDPAAVPKAAAISVAECIGLLGAPIPPTALAYWNKVLTDAPRGPFATHMESVLAARGLNAPGAAAFERRSAGATLAAHQWHRCKQHAERCGVSPSALVFAAFAEVVLEVHGQPAATFMMTTSERARLPGAAQELVGPFTSSIIVPVALAAGESFDELAERLHRSLWSHLEHGMLPAVSALRQAPESAAARGLPVVFTSLLGVGTQERGALTLRAASCQTSGVALEHQMWEQDGALMFHWDIADDLLPALAADLCLARLLARLHAIGAASKPGAALNRLQQAYFIERSAGSTSAPCCAVFSLDFASLDPTAASQVWADLVADHPALRSTVGADGSVALLDAVAAPLGISNVEAGALEARNAQLEQLMLGLPFPLARWPLQQAHMLCSPCGRASLAVCVDLMLLDARSIHLLIASLADRLSPDTVAAPRFCGAPVTPAAVRDAVTGSAYWSAKMGQLACGPALQSERPAARDWTRLQADLRGFAALQDACARASISVDDLLAAALAAAWGPELACPFTLALVLPDPADDCLRPAEHSRMAWVQFALGPRDGCVDLGQPLVQLARLVRDVTAADLAHGALDGLTALSMRWSGGNQPCTLPVVYTGLVDWGQLDPQLGQGPRWRTATAGIAFDAVALAASDRLLLAIDCIEHDFSPGQVRRVFERYRAALAEVCADPGRALRVAAVGAESVLAEPAQCAFERVAARYPEAIALRWSGGSWTFSQLNHEANRVAYRLRELGVGPGVTVAISLPRVGAMIAATLGVLKAGGAYVPVEPTLPAERAARMLEVTDCKIALVMSDRPATAALPAAVQCVAVDTLPAQSDGDRNPGVFNTIDTLAYIIFTSGSTGEPKGVAVDHRALHNLLDWCQRSYRFGPGDLGLCVTSLGFDLSVFDILGLLGYGAGLYLANEREQRDPGLLAAVLTDHPITFWNSAPTTLDQVSAHFGDLPSGAARERLRLVFLSGDYIPLALPPLLAQAFPHVRLVSLGGATEATVWSNYHEVGAIDPSWRSIPYGRPIENARYYILDEALQPCPAGVEGDLFIAGQVLSLGYYRREQLTAERFIRDPFGTSGERMYRSGDRAMFYPDGSMSFCGRADRQVKVRGVRIELEEIEHVLRRHPKVRDAVVLAQRDPSLDVKLVAYLLADADLEIAAMREFVQAKLPANMVPNLLHPMQRFPATSNGKLDRLALPWPLPDEAPADAPAKPAVAAAAVLPEFDVLVTELQQLFGRLLGRVPDTARKLWEQGATSFTIVQASAALRAAYGVRLQVEWLTRDPSVQGIARMLLTHLESRSPSGASANAVPVTLAAPATAPLAVQPVADVQLQAASADNVVDLFDPVAKQAFLASGANRRADLDGQARITLPLPLVPRQWLAWRGAQRSFGAGLIGRAQLGSLLGLLAGHSHGDRRAYLYPSAGDTYAVQAYLWVAPDRVEGLASGYYWFDSAAAALVRVGAASAFAREAQFIYNRALHDQAGLALFLVGERRAIDPLYGDQSERFLLLEAGYIGQLLMLGQYNSGLGLCPIGSFDTAPLAADLGLGESRQVLHSFLAGPVAYAVTPGVPAPLAFPSGSFTAPVAITGHALRYPGASTPAAFWELLQSGASVLRPAPARLGLGQSSALVGGFLDSIDGFDPMLFAIAPSDAAVIDPQTRLLLEVVWECLERAGHDSASLQHGTERVGVYVGHLWQDYRQQGTGATGRAAGICASGSEMAHRISQVFGFTGPSIAIDTACSSGLSALHLACIALAAGDCDSAIVCAVNLVAHPSHEQALSELGFVAQAVPTGAFDGATPGWAIGEGAGALLLRHAGAHGSHADQVLAQVLATHIEQAGSRAAYGAPSGATIAAGIRAALTRAGLAASDIGYVESAASGAAVADAAEWHALEQVFPGGVVSGTVKPNIGHLEAASGLSQLSKVLLQLEHGKLAPTRRAAQASALVDLDDGPVRLTAGAAFPAPGSGAHILVNAVGSTGASAQVILAAAPARVPAAASGPCVLLLSAATMVQLEQLAGAWLTRLPSLAASAWDGVCGTSQLARAAGPVRLALHAADPAQAQQMLSAFLRNAPAPGLTLSHADPALRGRAASASGFRGALQEWLAGCSVDWSVFWDGVPQRVALPTYPFARQSYWCEASSAAPAPLAAAMAGSWRQRLRAAFARASGIAEIELNDHVALEQYGLNSRIATAVAVDLSQAVPGLELPATLLYEVRDLAAGAALLERSAAAGTRPVPVPAPTSAPAERAVAITGLAGRYPGAADTDALWQQLLDGADLVRGPDPARVYASPGAAMLRGAFLDDVAGFDPFLFGITPNDACRMDPQERILLETVWHALEDACYPPTRIKSELGGKVGVFVGAMHNEYPLLGLEASTPERLIDAGATPAGMANRISYHLDLNGPSMTVDTMCSSSLSAMQLAIDALRIGRIDMAIVGSASLALHPNKFVQQERLQMTSSDHRCRSFGAGGNGFIPGEGAGVVVLRLLDQAQKAGDRIHGIVLGCAVNHGGKVNGFTVPSMQAQADLVRAALADAGVDPASVSYIEAHGTGTALGDPIETRGLAAALELGETTAPLSIGSIKSNLGHLEAAAGMAGLTKVLLQMRHKILAPSLHSAQGNPEIDWRHFAVPQAPQAWLPRSDGGRQVWRAGVSAFGAGGSNAHLVLEAAPDHARPGIPDGGTQVLVLSAATGDALLESARRLADFLARTDAPPPPLAAVAATLQGGREALRERWAGVCSSHAEAVTMLRTFAAGEPAGVRGRAVAQAGPALNSFDPVVQARAWTEGALVAWIPGQMAALPHYPFTRIRCWIDSVKDAVAVTPAVAAPKLAERVWRPAPRTADPAAVGDVLCLAGPDTRMLADALAARLAPRRLLILDAASATAPAPQARAGITALLLLCDLGASPMAWQSSFALCAEMARGAAVAPLHIVHAVRGVHAPSGAPTGGSGAELAGLLQALAAECRGVISSIVDVGSVQLTDAGACAALAVTLTAELEAPEAGDICVTPLGRMLPAWENVGPALPDWMPDPAQAYAITGGTRGLGARLARRLVTRGARRLGLMGRSRSAETDALISELQQQGVRVLVHYGAVEDGAATDAWLQQVEREVGPLDGIFHCAGISSRASLPLTERSAADLAAVMAPKSDGVAALLPAIARARPRFALMFSSVSAVVGVVGVGVGDYAAANRAMDYVAEQQHRRGYPEIKTVAWPVWRSSDAGAAASAVMERNGLPMLSDDEAFACLWAAIALPGSGRFCAVDAAVLARPVALSAVIATAPAAAPARAAAGPAPALGWLRELLAERTGLPLPMIAPGATFAELGVESIMLGRLVEDIEARIGCALAPGILLEHETAEALAAYFNQAGSLMQQEEEIQQKQPQQQRSGCTQLAVIGIAVRLPGAPDAERFWELLTEGRCAVTDAGQSRWDSAGLYDPSGKPGNSVSRWGGYLDGIEQFDPEFFDLGEQAGLTMDPAIRLFMEGVVTCLADAGLERAAVKRRNVGVYVGARMGDYRLRVARAGLAGGLGGDQNFIAAHVAHYLDLRGANMVVDSACSSSLSAVHMACQSILAGDVELALAGGVDVLLDEEVHVQFTRAGALSPSGRCRTFDRHADGFVPGEGCAVFLLKRLDRALEDGDRIHAVIEGSALNNDGRTMGLTTPNPEAQKDVILNALRRAGRSAHEIGMVEAHGTATMIGDPIELKALNDAYRGSTAARGYCAVASVKSNIGHLLSAAGAAGLAKTVLSVKYGKVPATLFCDTPNPRFDLAASPFYIPHSCSPWPLPGTRVAGVSAFGLGGSNAHVIVSEAPPHSPRRDPLPAPQFQRRRLWLDRHAEQHAPAPTGSSLLNLQFSDFVTDETANAPKTTTS